MTTPSPAERADSTYRYVRIIVVLPALWLLMAITFASLRRWPPNDSISDYYGGPLRDVFVGGLMACGICMIAYKGRSKLEDYALNFAGANTFLVALVPNSFTRQLAEARAAERTNVPPVLLSGELLGNLKIAVGIFLLLLLVFVVVDWKLMKWTVFRWHDQTRPVNWLITLTWVAEVGLVAVTILMMFDKEEIFDKSIFTVIHFGAAVLLVVNLSFAAASRAFESLHKAGESPVDQRARFFQGITAAMWIGLVVGGLCIFTDVKYAVIATEFYEIVMFLVFWIGATRSEWHLPRTRESVQAAARSASE